MPRFLASSRSSPRMVAPCPLSFQSFCRRDALCKLKATCTSSLQLTDFSRYLGNLRIPPTSLTSLFLEDDRDLEPLPGLTAPGRRCRNCSGSPIRWEQLSSKCASQLVWTYYVVYQHACLGRHRSRCPTFNNSKCHDFSLCSPSGVRLVK